MPAFEYHALDATGHARKGVLQADTARAARSSLRDRGLNPLEVDAVPDASPAEGLRSSGLRSALSSAQLVLLTRQMATLVASGLPIDEALQALAEGSEGRLQAQVVSLRARVMEGSSLALAMSEFPDTFPSIFRASVAAGESAGKLDAVLQRLAEYAESRDALRRKIVLTLTYPLLLTIVALAVVTGLMIWVVPQVIGVFLQYQQALPLPTRLLIAISGFIRTEGGWIAATLGVMLAALAIGGRNPRLRAIGQRHLLRIPLLGRLLRSADTTRFARTLALLVGSAVPLLDALTIATNVVQNRTLREALGRVSLRVREGQGFARALSESRQFPPVAVRLIASGEKSGRLDEMLFQAAANQERELDTALGVVMAALGPGVILAVGGMVLFIVLAVLLPIFELNTLIR